MADFFRNFRALGRLLFVCLTLAIMAGCTRTNEPTLNTPSTPALTLRPEVAPSPVQAPAPPVAIKPPVPSPSPSASATPMPRDSRPWRWIVIHHSATSTGGAVSFDKMHRDKGWDELGYHFVIGNGSDTGNGMLEVGPRWKKQKWGAHAKTPDNQFNDYGIGICLVGNFDETNPTPEQMRTLSELTARLMVTYNIPPDHVIGHSDTKHTECPGSHLSVASVRRAATARAQALRSTSSPGVFARTGQ